MHLWAQLLLYCSWQSGTRYGRHSWSPCLNHGQILGRPDMHWKSTTESDSNKPESYGYSSRVKVCRSGSENCYQKFYREDSFMTKQRSTTSSRGFLVAQSLGVMLVLAFALTASAADYVVVVNKGVSVNSLSRDDAEAIFLGDKSKWDDGKSIRIAILEGTSASKSFCRKSSAKHPLNLTTIGKSRFLPGKPQRQKPLTMLPLLSSSLPALPVL